MRFPTLTAVAAASLIWVLPAFAGNQDFSLVNKTGYQIDKVYVSPANRSSWGSDILGRDTLDDGDNVDITFSHDANACHWDLRVVYHDGDDATWQGLDLCNISRVSLFWDRRAKSSRAVTE